MTGATALTRRLDKLERGKYGVDSERIIITLGDETLTFKNEVELLREWLASFDAE